MLPQESTRPMSDKTKVTLAPSEETPFTPLDIVDQAYQEALAQYELDRDADNVAALKDANAAYEAMLAEQRKQWITDYTERRWHRLANPYKDKSPAEVYRLTRPYETRIDDLLAAVDQSDKYRKALLTEALKVFVYRNRSHISLGKAKDFLRPYMPVDGTFNDQGISPELYHLLLGSSLRITYGEVAWIIGYEDLHEPDTGARRPFGYQHRQRAILAHQKPQDSSRDIRTIPREDY
jgi:hypothetical protein